MTHRILTHAALLTTLALGLGAGRVSADRAEGEAAIAEAAARWGASAAVMTGIVHCETGGEWRTDLIGRAGELGPAQFLPGAGNGLAQFRALGYSDPTSWTESMHFLARQLVAGQRGQWHC